MESVGRGRTVGPEGLQQNDELFTPQNPFMNPYVRKLYNFIYNQALCNVCGDMTDY